MIAASNDLAAVGQLLAAASTASNAELRAVYVASARAIFDRARRQLSETELLVLAHEEELVRLAKGGA